MSYFGWEVLINEEEVIRGIVLTVITTMKDCLRSLIVTYAKRLGNPTAGWRFVTANH